MVGNGAGGRVAAYDPGRNVGFALVDAEGRAERLALATLDSLDEVAPPADAVVVVGSGTGRKELLRALRDRGLDPVAVDERGTSLEAQALWRAHASGRGRERWVPTGLRTPRAPIDQYAAWAIALRHLGLPLEVGRRWARSWRDRGRTGRDRGRD